MIKSLQQKMALFLLLPVALFLFSSWLLVFFFARDTLLEEWREASILELQRAAHHVDMRLSKPIEWTEMFHKTGDAQGGGAIQGWILNELRSLQGVSHVELEWARGNPEHMMMGSSMMDGMGAMHFRRARIAEVTPPHYDAQAGRKTVTLVSNLKDDSGRLIGTLKVAVRFDYLMEDVLKMGWWQTDAACIVDNHGRVLAHASASMEGRNRLGETDNPVELALLEEMQKKPFGTILGPGRPPKEVGGFYRIQDAPWTIILMAPGKSILAPIINFRFYFFAAGILSILVIVLLMRFVVGRMVGSIKDISQAAEKVTAGNGYGLPLQVKSKDEIGQLTQSFNSMVKGLKERDLVRNTFGRYMDEGIARELLSRPEAIRLGGQKREVAILMSDLRNFTSLSETMTPEGTLYVLNGYFSTMIEIIRRHQGIIVDFLGDAILVFFDPFDRPLIPMIRNAVDCAFEMQMAMPGLNSRNATAKLPELRMGIGVNAGEVVVGNIGSEARAKYGIVGTPVNLTQRIQSTAGKGEVVISENVYGYVGEALTVNRSFDVRLKGFQESVRLYAVAPLASFEDRVNARKP